tara:strand:- start:2073 stop:2873 length:801 start_codon:yes stop_codon:yes gene_type:complete
MNISFFIFKKIKDKFYAISALMILVFIFCEITKIYFYLMKSELDFNPISFFSVPADAKFFLSKPFSVLTYIFVHENIFHLVLNLFFLLIIRKSLLKIKQDFKMFSVFFLSALFSGFLFIFSYNAFPLLEPQKENTILIGSSSAIIGLFSFITFKYPQNKLNLFFTKIKNKHILLIIALFSLVGISKFNTGGNISHISAIFFGFIYFLFCNRKTKNKRSSYSDDQAFRDKKVKKEKEIDDILAKISQSGFDSLTKVEKDKLFKLSKK